MNAMKDPAGDAERSRQCLSNLMDGEADAQTVDLACAAWADEPASRDAWHVYHLIGDVLRSDELAPRPARDAAFHARLHERLAAEPVVLAPAPSGRPRRSRRFQWTAPVALAASFIAVAGVIVVARQVASGADARPPAWELAASAPAALALAGAPGSPDATTGSMLRDARIDDYLRAHRALLAGWPAALPGGAMRNVDLMVPPR